MVVTSPAGVAKDYAAMLDPEQKGSFANLRDAYLALVRAADDQAVEPGAVAASGMVIDLIERAIEDVTRAVPWDMSDILKDTRTKVMALIKDALAALATFDEEECKVTEALIRLGELRNRYLGHIEELNEKDRYLLRQPQGGGG